MDFAAPPVRHLATLLLVASVSEIVGRSVGMASAPAAAPPVRPPPLELEGTRCAVPVPEAAERLRAAEAAAMARVARYPFHPEDGVRAVRLLNEAASCARMLRDEARAAPIEVLAAEWARRLSSDYRSRVVRVSVALDRAPPAVALAEIRGLRQLLGQPAGAYARWLEREEQRLERGATSDPVSGGRARDDGAPE